MILRRTLGRLLTPTLAALAALALDAPQACADAFEVFGAGSRGIAMGGAQGATADDYGALYYNVAALALQQPHAGAGLVLSLDDVSVELKPRPSGYDLPDRGNASASIPSAYRLQPRADTSDIPNTYALQLGAVTDLGWESLRFGASLLLPLDSFASHQTRFPDEREQYFSNRLSFELLGERVQHQIILVGAAWKLNDWAAVGAGFSFLPGGTATTRVLVNNPTEQSQVDIALDNQLGGRIAPTFGLHLKPTSKISAGLSWRSEQYFELQGLNEVQIRGYQGTDDFPTLQRYDAVLQYTPDQLNVGTAYHDEGTTLAVDVTWALWSNLRNQQGHRDQGWKDTFSYRLGVEHRYKPSILLRAGLAYVPSPVPDQTGRTNYVDNDRVAVSIGTGHPIQAFGRDLEVGWSLQWQHLRPRDTNKARSTVFEPCADGVTVLCDEVPDDLTDPSTGAVPPEHLGLQTGNPGFPGFTSYGELLTMGVDVRWRF